MNRKRIVRRSLLLALVLLAALAATPAMALLALLSGLGIGTVTINGNVATARISVLGIVGTELILEFEDARNLTAQNLGLSARAINPLAYLDRLPGDGLGGLLTVALPLEVVVEPPASGGLTFTNTVRAELHTHMLGFTVDSPLRLYKAPHGGTFFDITSEVAPGSVRTRGRTGDFSDFIIVLDLLPSADQAQDKYSYLDQRVATAAMDGAVRVLLRQDLAASRAAFDAGDHAQALYRLSAFTTRVRSHAGVAIPNVWRSQRDRDNVAGDLLGNADSLAFSIDRASRE